MFEFLIGTRFYYKGKLVEVVEIDDKDNCNDCVFDKIWEDCENQLCRSADRNDNKYVHFKEVKDECDKDCMASISR